MKKILIAAVAMTAISAPAYAQPEASNFGGAKVGLVLGYDKLRFSEDGIHASKDGLLYGITAGYDVDLGSAVIGIEGEATDSTIKESVTDVALVDDKLSLMADRDLYVGARVGFPVSPTLLVYAKAGYTNARAKLKYSYSGLSASVGDNIDGYRVGGGVEYTNGREFGRLEYRYSDYGHFDYTYSDANVTFDGRIKTVRHQIAVTGGWRF
ncbi:outer membrane protein [Sphingobium sp. EM0848]|uniref:outer membrane protein n=1 Tax=Sphingobium sp. EM0848 TaxID=2743473 RepID=UPI001C3FCABF|nr:outer membrane beta-barrel protein [Sphingobium sp. EM0848]